MEKHISQKVDGQQLKLKNDIKAWFDIIDCAIVANKNNTALMTGEFMQFVFDHIGVKVAEEDFKKRKRIKNSVPQFELCIAKRANGDQCTRRRKINEDNKEEHIQFCGTHVKGTPHGVVATENDNPLITSNKKVEVWVKDIKGINYYIDAQNNVYKPEDILTNKVNPAVIAKWVKVTEDIYAIPQFDI